MKYNGELKNFDNQEKAYLLGFLYGDGCITTYRDGNRVRFQTKISIHEKDKKLIWKIKKLFPFFQSGEFDYSKYNKNSGKQFYVRSSSNLLYNDLLNNGLLNRKSYENKEMLNMPNLHPSLIRHFIRGFFDADGSVFKLKNRENLIKIEITSNSKNLINQLNNYLVNHNIETWKVSEKQPRGNGRQLYYNLSIIKSSEIIKFKNYIYDEATIFLERKKEIFDSFRIVDKVIDRFIPCPKCGGKRTIKNGIRNNKIRMKCSSCKTGFTLK